MIGFLYDSYKVRDMWYYRYGNHYALYSRLFFLLILANLGFPLSQFCCRIFYLTGIASVDITLSLFSGIALFGLSGLINFGFLQKYL